MSTNKFTTKNFYESTNYELFRFFDFNRGVNKTHVKKLKGSITERGFCGVILVILTAIFDKLPTYYILDGQHRFTAAKELGVPFSFELIGVDSPLELAKYMADVNNSSQAWGTNQFLKIWSDMRIKEYSKLLKVEKETKIQITPLVKIYTGKTKMDEFRKGNMKFIDEANSDKIVSQIIDLNAYLPTKAFCRRAIIDVMNNKNYNHELVKPFIIRYATQSGFTENESELKVELTKCITNSIKKTLLVA